MHAAICDMISKGIQRKHFSVFLDVAVTQLGPLLSPLFEITYGEKRSNCNCVKFVLRFFNAKIAFNATNFCKAIATFVLYELLK